MTDFARITQERDDLQAYLVRLATLHPPLPNDMVETQVPVDPVIVQLAERLVAAGRRAEKAEREVEHYRKLFIQTSGEYDAMADRMEAAEAKLAAFGPTGEQKP